MLGPLIFWSTVIIALIAGSIFVATRVKNKKTALLSTLISLLTPVVIVGIDCLERSTSEACVWGKSFMPLYIGVALIIGAPIMYLLITSFTWAYAKFINKREQIDA